MKEELVTVSCCICFILGVIFGIYNQKKTCLYEINSLKQQITLRDSINAHNKRINERDSIRIEWLFTHDRK